MRALRTHGPHTVLTPQAIDALFRGAEVLTEGSFAGEPGLSTWFGTVLMTFDLTPLVVGATDTERELVRVTDAIAGSVRVRILAHRIARAQLRERYPDRALGTAQLESHFRRTGALLFLDVDLEAPIEVVCSTRRRAR